VPDVLVAPAVAYGASGEHQDFAGTLSIGRDALELMLVELGRSACAAFRGLVLVSAHGGNAEPVARAIRRLSDEGGRVLSWAPHFGGDAHAGRVETSIILALDASSVLPHDDVAGNPEPLGRLWTALRSDGVRAVSPMGVLGDPAGASADEGRRLLDAAAADLVATVRRCFAPAPAMR
jgi:mycofactocin precursor peptide peptidase